MLDPTHEEMLEALKPLDDEMGDAEVAIYWFANDWHGGQWSNLYSVLSTSVYRPGPISTLESEGDTAVMFYEELEAAFA